MEYLDGFGTVLLFIVGGLIFVSVTLFVGKLLRPNRPGEQKLTTYESGEETVGNAWGNFNVRFYVVALIFLLFEVELVFLFPWAIVFGDAAKVEATNGLWGKFALVESFIFIAVLLVGLAYAWANGMLDWVKPAPEKNTFRSPVPKELYHQINKKYEQ
ncbi:MAG: NADH-quinone oxidoreductase subunit A [Cyclobacteriaceae bacterium]|nr:NADH-quinone oxidoreductase subunit A [Cyclobacteriaceae bacterium HetDA_MAG_MS6]